MTTRRSLLKSLSIVPAALLAPKVALGMGAGPRLVERPWDALVGLDLIQVRHSLKTKGYTMKTACGRSFVWGKYVPPGEDSMECHPFLGKVQDVSQSLGSSDIWIHTKVMFGGGQGALYEIC